MSFYLYVLAGIAGGILGGMGMGGGTALIPILSVLCGVGQDVAQGVNLLSFLPMSLVALSVHARKGLVKRAEALSFSVPALLTSALFSALAVALPTALLKTAFGGFLILLACFRLKSVLNFQKR